MQGPDPFLSQYYGTSAIESPEGDLEKTAQLHLLQKLAAEEGIDVTQLSDEMVTAVCDELFGAEKEAGVKEVAGKVVGAVKGVARKAGKAAKEAPGKAYEGTLGRVGKSVEHKLDSGVGERTRRLVHRLGGAKKGVEPSHATWSEGKKRLSRAAEIATGVGAAGAVGGTGYGGYKGVQAIRDKKKESALDVLASARAYDLLNEHGYVDQEGNIVPPQQKTARDVELEQAIEYLALQKLAEAGYPVE